MLGPALGWCGDHPSTLKNRSMPPGDAGRRGWRCGADCHRGYLARVHNRVVGKAALRQQDAIRPTFDAHIRDVDRLCARILEGDHSPERGVPWRAAKPAAQQSSSRRRPGRALPGGTAAPQRTTRGYFASEQTDGRCPRHLASAQSRAAERPVLRSIVACLQPHEAQQFGGVSEDAPSRSRTPRAGP